MASNSRTASVPIAGNTAAMSPTSQRPDTITVKGFKISTQKLPILKAGPIEAMAKKLGIAPPEMIFGDNFVSIEHEKSGWSIHFNALDALDRVDKTGESMLEVAHSKEWQKSRCVRAFGCDRFGTADILTERQLMKVSKMSSNHLTGPTVQITRALYCPFKAPTSRRPQSPYPLNC